MKDDFWALRTHRIEFLHSYMSAAHRASEHEAKPAGPQQTPAVLQGPIVPVARHGPQLAEREGVETWRREVADG